MRFRVHSAMWAQETAEAMKQHGLMGVLARMWAERRVSGAEQIPQLKLLETLSLGPKRQLMLVRCGEEQFLIGGGLDRVEAIVKVGGDASCNSQKAPQVGRCG